MLVVLGACMLGEKWSIVKEVHLKQQIKKEVLLKQQIEKEAHSIRSGYSH